MEERYFVRFFDGAWAYTKFLSLYTRKSLKKCLFFAQISIYRKISLKYPDFPKK